MSVYKTNFIIKKMKNLWAEKQYEDQNFFKPDFLYKFNNKRKLIKIK